MLLTCPECQKMLHIDAAKAKSGEFPCENCKAKLIVDNRGQAKVAPPPPPPEPEAPPEPPPPAEPPPAAETGTAEEYGLPSSESPAESQDVNLGTEEGDKTESFELPLSAPAPAAEAAQPNLPPSPSPASAPVTPVAPAPPAANLTKVIGGTAAATAGVLLMVMWLLGLLTPLGMGAPGFLAKRLPWLKPVPPVVVTAPAPVCPPVVATPTPQVAIPAEPVAEPEPTATPSKKAKAGAKREKAKRVMKKGKLSRPEPSGGGDLPAPVAE